MKTEKLENVSAIFTFEKIKYLTCVTRNENVYRFCNFQRQYIENYSFLGHKEQGSDAM